MRPPIHWPRPVSILILADCIQIEANQIFGDRDHPVSSVNTGRITDPQVGFTVGDVVGDVVEAASKHCLFPSGKTVMQSQEVGKWYEEVCFGTPGWDTGWQHPQTKSKKAAHHV